ncbi:MAG: tetratricopeptide repeat protein [Planctomycetaceae bacterium]
MPGCSGGGTGAEHAAGGNPDAASSFEKQSTPPAAGPTGLKPGGSTDAFLAGGSTKPVPASPSQGTASDPGTTAPPLEPRTSLEGRWEVALHGVGGNNIFMLIDITPADDGFAVKGVGESPRGWTLAESEISGNDVHLTFQDPAERTIDFEGTFADGQVRGNVDTGSAGLDLATLRPSARQQLNAEDVEEPTAEYEQLRTLKQDEHLLANIIQLAKDSHATPMGFQLSGQLLNTVQQKPAAEIDLPALFEDHLAAAAHWGGRVIRNAHLDIAFTLALRSEQQAEALKHLDLAEQGLSDDVSEALQEKLALTRGLILVDGEETRDQGIEILQQSREKNPYNLLATSKLAQVYELQGNLEDSLAMHAEIIALPSVPGDRGKTADLWGKLGRDPEELDAFLDEVYEKLLYRFSERDEPAAPAIEGQQILLGELFTGATCPPCVAADVATGALERIYPPSRLLMIRYHQHIPGPDPMTVADGELRRDYYELKGTPTMFFNGQQIQAGGSFFNAPTLYASLKQFIAPLLEQTSDLAIDLAADADAAGESIHIRAAVRGADGYPENWRLRMCLAEETIHYPAPNGIRIHEMVVRTMPGGANGVVAEEKGFSYEADIPVNEILAQIEEGSNAANSRSGGALPPLAVEIAHLRLIAFVQDDDTLEVLQAASTPVNGLAATALSRTETPDKPPGAAAPE